MIKFFLVVMGALGSSLIVGGLFSFIFGSSIVTTPIKLNWFRPYEFTIYPYDYCFLGAVMSAVGTGLFTLGVLGIWSRRPPDDAM